MGKKRKLKYPTNVKRYSISSVYRKNANYRRLVHSSSVDHFGDNVTLASGAGHVHTLPTYLQSFSMRLP